MKLSEQERLQAEKKLKNLSIQMNITETIKNKAKEQTKRMEALFNKIKQAEGPVDQKVQLLAKITEQVLESALKLEGAQSLFSTLDQKTRNQKEKAVTERIKTVADKEKYSEAIEDIKSTIAKIKKTVKDAQTEEDKKRTTIETDLEKSLNEIRQKIKTQDEEAIITNQQTATLKAQIAEQRAKLEGLQGQYQSQANLKEDEVKKDKGDLLDKLKVLETEATEVTRLNTEFSSLEKKNFDSKLTIYIRQTKFPEYAGSFQNTARVLSQCKDELFKGVQRINELKARKDKLQQNSEKYDKDFLALLGSNNALKQQIEKVKKSKETVRTSILALQSQIKVKRDAKAN